MIFKRFEIRSLLYFTIWVDYSSTITICFAFSFIRFLGDLSYSEYAFSSHLLHSSPYTSLTLPILFFHPLFFPTCPAFRLLPLLSTFQDFHNSIHSIWDLALLWYCNIPTPCFVYLIFLFPTPKISHILFPPTHSSLINSCLRVSRTSFHSLFLLVP